MKEKKSLLVLKEDYIQQGIQLVTAKIDQQKCWKKTEKNDWQEQNRAQMIYRTQSKDLIYI